MAKDNEYIWLPKGVVLKDTYRIKRKIARSNLSIVYLGVCQKTGEKCIIKEHYPAKLVLRDLNRVGVVWRRPWLKGTYLQAQAHFFKEADILKDISSEYIVKYIDHFVQNKTGYIVLEYCPGVTLEQFIAKEKNVSITGFLKDIYLPLMKALEQIHKKGIIHRDLKPSNIVIKKNGKPVIIDFGSAVDYRGTEHKQIFVTPGFSPLEFYSKTAKQGRYSDVYSLAATLYYYLSGKTPLDVSQRIIDDQIEDIRSLNKIISARFAKVIMANLALIIANVTLPGRLRRAVRFEYLRLKLWVTNNSLISYITKNTIK